MKFIKNFFKRFIDEYLKDVLVYSFLFLCIYSVILYIFGYYNKSFIWLTDGLTQHFITLKYFKGLITDYINNGTVNTFIWNLGYGLDMFANMAYYSIGDFLMYLIVNIKETEFENFYNLAVGIRLWMVGISFILYSRYKRINGVGVIIGALMYTFCIRTCFLGFSHPYMLNASWIFPLLLIVIERSLKDNKNIFLIIISVITFLQGFYFAYMMFVVAALYGIIFAFSTYKKRVHIALLMLFKTLLLGILSLGLSSIIVYPSIMMFLNSSRAITDPSYSYTLYHFHELSLSFISHAGVYNSYIGLVPLFIIGLAVYPYEKKDYAMYIITVFLIVALFIPETSSFLVGFSYPLNRWTYMLCFFLSFMTAASLNNDFIINHRIMKRILVLSVLFLVPMLVFEKSGNLSLTIGIITLLIVCSLYINNKKNKFSIIRNAVILLITSVALSYNLFVFFGAIDEAYIRTFTDNLKVDELLSNNYDGNDSFQEALTDIKKDESYYNILKYPSVFYSHNISLYNDYNSINFYYSINQNNYSGLASDLDNADYNMSYEIGEFNYRTRITSYLGNKYMITSNPKYVPYGYSLVKKYDDTTYLYKNNYVLPFAILYVDKVDLEDYENLTPYEREILLYKTSVLDKEIEVGKFKEYKKYILKDYSKEKVSVSYNNKKLNNQDISISVTDTGNDILNVKLNNVKNREVYVKINNIKFDYFNENELINQNVKDFTQLEIDRFLYKNKWINQHGDYKISVSSNGKWITEQFRDEVTSPYYFENNDLYINIGYFENFKGNINIRFGKKGKYTFDSVEVITVNFNSYKTDVNDLRESGYQFIDYDNGYFKCSINPTNDGIIQFNTNYSSGWSVYVDNKKVDTFKSNLYFLGIKIDKGYHEVELRYETPYLKDGIKISKISLVIFEWFICLDILIRFIYFKRKKA